MDWTNIEKWFYGAIAVVMILVGWPFAAVYYWIKFIIDLVMMVRKSKNLDEFITELDMYEG